MAEKVPEFMKYLQVNGDRVTVRRDAPEELKKMYGLAQGRRAAEARSFNPAAVRPYLGRS